MEKELDTFFAENFSENLDFSKIKRPEDYVWFRLNFSLEGSSISLK